MVSDSILVVLNGLGAIAALIMMYALVVGVWRFLVWTMAVIESQARTPSLRRMAIDGWMIHVLTMAWGVLGFGVLLGWYPSPLASSYPAPEKLKLEARWPAFWQPEFWQGDDHGLREAISAAEQYRESHPVSGGQLLAWLALIGLWVAGTIALRAARNRYRIARSVPTTPSEWSALVAAGSKS